MTFNKYSRSVVTIFIASIFLIAGVYIKRKIENRYNSVEEYILKDFPKDVKYKFIGKNQFSTNDEVGTNGALVHFWATWCAPCEAELPDFLSFSKNFPNIKFLIVASKDEVVKVKKFLSKFNINDKNLFFILDDSGEIMRKFGTLRLPETYFFDSNRRIVKKFVGPQDWTNEYFLRNFNYLISL